MIEKKCEICDELFLARAKNYKYCSNCRKKAGYNRVIKYRTSRAESKEKIITIKSAQDILKRSPYSDVFYSVFDTFQKKLDENFFKEPFLTWSELKRASKLKNDGDFLKHYHAWIKFGFIKKISRKKSKVYVLNDGYKYDFLRLHHGKVAENTPVNNIMAHGEYTYYFQDIKAKEIYSCPEIYGAFNEINRDIDILVDRKMYILLRAIARRHMYNIWQRTLSHNPQARCISLFFLWINLLINLHDNFAYLKNCISITTSEQEQFANMYLKKKYTKLHTEFYKRKEEQELLFEKVLIKAITKYLSKKYPSANINIPQVNKHIKKYESKNNKIFEDILMIKTKTHPYTMMIDHIDYEDNPSFIEHQRELDNSWEIFCRDRETKERKDEFKLKNDLKNHPMWYRKVQSKLYFKKRYRKIIRQRSAIHQAYGPDTCEYMDWFVPNFGEKSPTFELLKKLSEQGFVPGETIEKHTFFSKNNFFGDFINDLKNLSLVEGKKEKIVFIPESSIKHDFVSFQEDLAPFKNLNELHKHLDGVTNVFPIPVLPDTL